jgi:hypothetical protein
MSAKGRALVTTALVLLLASNVLEAKAQPAPAAPLAPISRTPAEVRRVDIGAVGQGRPGVSSLPVRPEEEPSRVTSLEEAIALAYRRNPTLLAERATVRANDEEVTQGRAAYGPQVGLSGGITFTDDSTEVAFLPTPLNRSGTVANYALSLQQTIFSSGRNYARLFNAIATVEFARENLRAVEANVLANVIRTYTAVRRDHALVEISRENLDLLSRQFIDIRRTLPRTGDYHCRPPAAERGPNPHARNCWMRKRNCR